jgi:antibiotic biosynthesis monooxygenase (ABM) superfamily enzyme
VTIATGPRAVRPAAEAPVDARGPVTVVVRRRVRPGREAAYEDWLSRLVQGAAALPGFLGTEIHRPAPGAAVREYTSIYRFDSAEHLRAFEESEVRARALEQVVDLVEEDARWERLSGLELWFTPPAGTVVPQPSRFRMALLLIAVIYGLVLVLGGAVAALFPAWPLPARMLLTIVIEVFLMTYVVMPRVTRWAARWIYPRRRGA